MKLKEIIGNSVSKKTLSILNKSIDKNIEQVKKDFSDTIVDKGNGSFEINISNQPKKTAPYITAALIKGGLYLIQQRDPEYHDELHQQILEDKGEAEIDKARIEKMFPELKILGTVIDVVDVYNKKKK